MIKRFEGHLSAAGLRFGIIVSRTNGVVTEELLRGAVDCLVRHGASEEDLAVIYSPGAFEIPFTALAAAQSGAYDALVCLGCVIRGETPHFDFIAAEVTKGVAQVGLQTGVPASFGVLTTETLDQALERAGSKGGNKGWDAALGAIETARLAEALTRTGKRPRK
ncbi:MAG: 6,7-dimethyl-8-ribityllumazine synthase [Bacteroidota bacterium]